MKESVFNFSKVALTLRPAKNTSHNQSGPQRLTGVSTVIAVALPSTFATAGPYAIAARGGVQVRLARSSRSAEQAFIALYPTKRRIGNSVMALRRDACAGAS